jgi:HAD superfamily hydrolase (TIGR01509 family)
VRGVYVQQGEVVAIDLEQQCVRLFSPVVQDRKELPYDHLILALGSVATFRHAPGAAEHSFPFKHLGDAQRIHDRVLDCFDWAAGESDPAQRRALLTFVVAVGGFAGVELAAALADFVREAHRFYPRLAGEHAQVLLVHHGARLVQELPESAAAYTHKRLQQQGVDLRTRTAVTGVTPSRITLFLQRLRDRGVAVFPGSLRYVQALRAAGLRLAVVSSSENTTQVLEAAGLRDSFDAQVDGIVANRDGLRGKPSPDTYLAAANALHVAPPQAAVFEDALAGVEAGRAGGFGRVVGVDRLGQRDALLQHGADVVVADLAELVDVEDGADGRSHS